MINAKLAIGPMSTEVIEAVYRYSHFNRKELMIIASKNQIDYNGGYVNKWTTGEFMEFIKKMRNTFQNSNVKICRDHCGPGFNGNYDLEDTYKTIETDIKNGFDLIHIDFCNFKGMNDERLEESKKAIEHCLRLNPHIALEIGTDENAGDNYSISTLDEMGREIDFFKQFSNPEFYVVQTGSLVKEINQVGNFNSPFVGKIREMLNSKGLKLKEHNADYLSSTQMDERKNLVDAMNIAPQLGVVQTAYILTKCLIYGVKIDDFVNEVYAGGKWGKWLHNNDKDNKFLCAIIAGHYHFNSENYKKIISELGKHEEVCENIINKIMEVIEHYDRQGK